MTEFERSEWFNRQHVKEFVENSDNYIIERKTQFKILGSFYNYFIKNRDSSRVMDLGCGDGRITGELLKLDEDSEYFLVDGSSEMLDTAKTYLNRSNIHFINETFQNLMVTDSIKGNFDFIVSSLAIHHLSTEEKNSLFKYIYNHLKEGGYFLNMDVVLPPSDHLEKWYLILWNVWINEHNSIDNEDFQNLPIKYKNNPDNHPDSLELQMDLLKKNGFKNVDCHYKYGIFTIYSGQK